MPNIVFGLLPPPSEETFNYHLGAGYIRSYLQYHAIQTAQYSTSRSLTVPDTAAGILQYNPDAVGFTCYDWNYAYVRILSRVLKKKSDLTIAVGGPTATFSDREIMNQQDPVLSCTKYCNQPQDRTDDCCS